MLVKHYNCELFLDSIKKWNTNSVTKILTFRQKIDLGEIISIDMTNI